MEERHYKNFSNYDCMLSIILQDTETISREQINKFSTSELTFIKEKDEDINDKNAEES